MCESGGKLPHSAQCVYRHALLLSYLAYRGAVDEETNPKAAATIAKIPALFRQSWAEGLVLDSAEKRFFDIPLGSLQFRERVEASWLVEGMAVLSWAIGVTHLPPFFQKIEATRVSVALGIFRPDAGERISQAALRDENEIIMGARTYHALACRLSQYFEDKQPTDFQKQWMDPDGRHLTVDGLEFVNGDLAIEGTPLETIPKERLEEIGGIIYERNRRFRWLLGFERCLSTVTVVN